MSYKIVRSIHRNKDSRIFLTSTSNNDFNNNEELQP